MLITLQLPATKLATPNAPPEPIDDFVTSVKVIPVATPAKPLSALKTLRLPELEQLGVALIVTGKSKSFP
jgi:hypothetical protein